MGQSLSSPEGRRNRRSRGSRDSVSSTPSDNDNPFDDSASGVMQGTRRGPSQQHSTEQSDEDAGSHPDARATSTRSSHSNENNEPSTPISSMNEPNPFSIRRNAEDEEDGGDTSSPPIPPELRTSRFTIASPIYHSIFNEQNQSEEDSQATDMAVRSIRQFVASVPVREVKTNEHTPEFRPIFSRDFEWMGRSIETLILGHESAAPILHLVDPQNDNLFDDSETSEFFLRRRSSTSTFAGAFGGGFGRRRSSQGSAFTQGNRRVSLTLSGGTGHGGTLASYYNRRRSLNPTDVDRGRRISTSFGPMVRRRSSMASSMSAVSSDDGEADQINISCGPNVVLSLMARESTGRTLFPRDQPASKSLDRIGGMTLHGRLDKRAGGIVSEVNALLAAIEGGDWTETQTIVSRVAPRLISDLATPSDGRSTEEQNLPPNCPKFYAGGGRMGLERDAFVQAGGTSLFLRLFREKAFVGQEMAASNDARNLSKEIVASRLANCWNDALQALRDLVYFIPSLVTDEALDDSGDFLPFLFTLLSHDPCFDHAASLIEEILSFMSQSSQPTPSPGESPSFTPTGRIRPATTFFLGNISDLYGLWRSLSCRQLAHFCRILALLIFEPEDRQLLESPAVLKSLELLQLRRNRAARAGKDSTVDMNQSIVLGDPVLVGRLLQLLRIMNYAPPLRRFSAYHIMAQYPFIAETLVMLGLGELESFSETERQNRLARKLLVTEDRFSAQDLDVALSDLGSVAEMLEGLSETLSDTRQGGQNQMGHIISVISAAQEAGVIVGRDHTTRRRTQRTREGQRSAGNVGVDDHAVQGLASVAGILTDQILASRLYQNEDRRRDSNDQIEILMGVGLGPVGLEGNTGHLINTPQDAANSLQFNAMLLGPFQVEILFVLCTLLGGRRKLDAQNLLHDLGVISVLNDMFQRLPWYRCSTQSDEDSAFQERNDGDQPNGIHGPGCECTPESALCVQYLRLLHNFCDRDCDNYAGRRLLLSESERLDLFGEASERSPRKKGLLLKIIEAFMRESDESPYRFWLASCIESYLRGSSPKEQMFTARSGLLDHLVTEVSCDRLHCAGSLQTSFDLLGELIKGNAEIVRLLIMDMDEERFRKFMSVAAANLVDSNVFIRSLLLSLERFTASRGPHPIYIDKSNPISSHGWTSTEGSASRSYLTHSWWEATPLSLFEASYKDKDMSFEFRPTDWFPSLASVIRTNTSCSAVSPTPPSGLHGNVGHFGWVFTPSGESLAPNTFLPNSLERLAWFLAVNQTRLLRDLLSVVDLKNINHENICCLNTAVVVAIFAYRRQQLAGLLEELRTLSSEEKDAKQRSPQEQDDVVDRAFVQAMRHLDLSKEKDTPSYARRASILTIGKQHVGDRTDVLRNFREVLWFWSEYYSHRGRDRLSLEFSSHIRFQEWNHVVSLLAADDGSATSLVRAPVKLPRSPYQRATRAADNPMNGF
ncbi:Trpc4-associated protein [Fistulifera solaris]|uniref:Trpc4-associated protein n=1 Tax=Fistulifera solaris TaxID=1519565 RepID=A0A1Z5K595_FISSO|nr:Trpc4-associated protein [Fistulifera solaris]|eukprot:GAX21342.1 Trpc4-associated protein [Fistulifera solaris]